MANNRMFLVHVPTGKCVFLAKHMGEGWYGVPDDIRDRIVRLFEETYPPEHGHPEDFALAMEDSSAAPGAIETFDGMEIVRVAT